MRLHILSFILTSFFLQFVQAQEGKKSHIGIHFTPQITNQIFVKSSLGESKASLGMSIGLDYFHQISERIEIKTGVTYQFSQVNQNDYTPTFNCDLINFSFNPLNSWHEDQYAVQYIGIPLEGKLSLSKEPNHFYTKLGVEGQLRLLNSAERTIVECQTNRLDLDKNQANEFKNTNMLLNFGIGYEIDLNNERQLYFEPQISSSINTLFIQESLVNNSRLLNLGIVLGVKM